MNHFFRFCVLVALAAVGTSRASADLVLDTPNGLSVGDRFRFIFVTGSSSSTYPTSSDINSYDTFVRNNVSSLYGTVTYGESAITNWLAVGSTPTVNAKDHLGGYSSSVSAWLPDGTQVASSLDTATGGLWSGNLGHKINQYLDGSTLATDVETWTGSGTAGLTDSTYPLGGSGPYAMSGWTGYTSGGYWIEYGNDYKTNSYAMYAVSPELTVQGAPSSVPEIDPATGGSALSLVAGVLAMIEQRRRRRGKALALTT